MTITLTYICLFILLLILINFLFSILPPPHLNFQLHHRPPLNLLLLVLLPSLMFGMRPWPMLEELFALQNQGMWTWVPPPSNRNVVCCRWDYKIKRPPDVSIARRNPSPLLRDIISKKALWKLSVINTATVCIVLSLDVINGFLREEMYKLQPHCFVGTAFS